MSSTWLLSLLSVLRNGRIMHSGHAELPSIGWSWWVDSGGRKAG